MFPEEKHIDLVELMKNFELCFQLPNTNSYIIPELLRANQPELDWWHYEDNLKFKYQYDFMPAGIMTRFIVIAHDLIKSDIYWKDGVLLEWEDTRAMVIKTDPRRIDICIEGLEKKLMLSTIRRHMDYLHRPFSNLNVSEMVPCLCRDCREDRESYFFPYENLMKARKKGKRDIECQNSFEDVPIDFLLGEIGAKTAPPIKVEDGNGSQLRTVKLFLASSSELKPEREKIERFIAKENRNLIAQSIFIDLVIWEDLKLGFHGNRIQDYFNEQMLKCDIVVFLFFKKLGDYTKEEFDIAYEHFKHDNKPSRLYVYFKSEKVDIEEIDQGILKIIEIKNEIEKSEQIYNKFSSSEDLELKLKRQLDLILPEI